jgi:glycosyltransferase involved in cell wall biosynthesis
MFVLFTNPAAFPSMERAATLLHKSGCAVRILGTSGSTTDAMGATRLREIDVRLISVTGDGLAVKIRYLLFVGWALANMIVWRPEWLYASDTLVAPVALLAKWAGVRVLYHEHDAPVESKPSIFIRIALRARAALMRRADVVVTPSAGRSAIASLETGRPVLTVWNCPSRTELRERATPAEVGRRLRLMYQGSLVPARLPLTVVDAVARAGGEVELWFAGYETVGSGNHGAAILRRAAELGIADKVRALPVLPREAMLDRTTEGDLGIALMPSMSADINERTMAGASNKAFEYLACGLPLLISDLEDWRRTFADNGVALVCDPTDVASITRVLDDALGLRDDLARMGARGRELVKREWNYETQFAPVMQTILGSPPDSFVPEAP